MIEQYEKYIDKIQEDTDILATETNIELISTFFKANGFGPGLEVSSYKKILFTEEDPDNVFNEKYYNAVCVKYPLDDNVTGILLLNIAAKHHGLDNMLSSYLLKLNVSPIKLRTTVYTKKVTTEEVDKNFLTKVAPHIKTIINKSPLRKSYAGIKE